MATGVIVSPGVQVLFDLVGIFAFGLSGALLAVRKSFDVVGMTVLAAATALGGGAIRDALAREVPAVPHPQSEIYAIPFLLGSALGRVSEVRAIR